MPDALPPQTKLRTNQKTPTRRPSRPTAERPPVTLGWLSSDADEIERRRWRGKTEIPGIEPLEPGQPWFGRFRVRSASGGSYEVEIRSLTQPINTCDCADHRGNGLGTCKHVEGALAQLQNRGRRGFARAQRLSSPRVELFLDRAAGATPSLLWPTDPAAAGPARSLLAPLLNLEGGIADPSPAGIETILRAIAEADPTVQSTIRVSAGVAPWLAEAQRRAARSIARNDFVIEVEAGRQTLDVLHHKLLPYQRAGALHLAFNERALLADDMGLGKTIQAIAACELLRRLRGVERVLVVCPASLKGEWQEQIARFSGATTALIQGARVTRLAQYERPGFFTVVNYEQVVSDAEDINRRVRPDIVILDEAQRIKNWQTKTARRVKMLQAPYAFVLTGTPIENRIDEIYSIVQFLDPDLLGPLFRFNRVFYQLDERGRPTGYQNLDELMRRLQPVMLRRRKADVETELPGRTVKNFVVPMAEEQRLRYDEYKGQAARLIKMAQRRPLSPKEYEKLQRLLACMRMLCDTPFILDPACRISPKIEELERVLTDLLADPDRKIIIFSEWERMLMLVRELAQDMGVEFAWHTGTVPQDRRRAEIGRFKQDPACRLFLSTDSGSVGLNLQAASAVINLDLPWNPAKLEQRIARAWRKNQMRSVDVINLVTEDSIEHAMLQVLAQKQALADGVLDGTGELKAMALPSGRRAMVDRLAAMMEPAAPTVPTAPPAPDRNLQDDLVERHGEALLLIEAHRGADGNETLLVVLEAEAAAAERQHQAQTGVKPVEVIDRATWETIQRLSGSGVLQPADGQRRPVFRSEHLASETGERERVAQSAERLSAAERKLRMALLLAQGGFVAEAMPALDECLALAADARRLIAGEASAVPSALPQVTEPARPPDEIAGAIESMLGEVRRSLSAVRLAA